MKRRALIIYCDNTHSGRLPGPPHDHANYSDFLESNLGGAWKANEIKSLQNPTVKQVSNIIGTFMSGSDYTFIVFSGHGFTSQLPNNMFRQYMEVADGNIPINNLKTNAPRQSIIVDACRGIVKPYRPIIKAFSESLQFIGGIQASTRQIFDNAVLAAEGGLTVLYSARVDQSSLDTTTGGAFLLSMLKVAQDWEANKSQYTILPIDIAKERATNFMLQHFETIQQPSKNLEKRIRNFPFAVKFPDNNTRNSYLG